MILFEKPPFELAYVDETLQSGLAIYLSTSLILDLFSLVSSEVGLRTGRMVVECLMVGSYRCIPRIVRIDYLLA